MSDYSFTLYNLPGAATAVGAQNIGNTTPAPPFRVRAICSDGTLGETELAFPEFGSTVVYTGEIFWRALTPVPLALGLTASQTKLTTGQTAQLTTTGVLANASTIDLTGKDKGTLYTTSNPLIATVSDSGLAAVSALFASGSAARVVITAQNDGVSGTLLLQLGPRGTLNGTVTAADGKPVAGAQVTVLRNQPRESLGTVTTDSNGIYELTDVSAGAFSVSVIDPATGDLGRADGVLQNDGQVSIIDVKLNGQGTVTVNVVDGANQPVPGAAVTFTSLSGFTDLRTLLTNTSGQAVFSRALAGRFTVSTLDPVSNLVGALVDVLPVGGNANLTLQLQPVGAISGTVFDSNGTTVLAGIQVRLVSAVRGVVTQTITGPDGKFRFDTLPLSDSPYTLDAIQDGRLRARVPSLILNSGGQELNQNIVFSPAGSVIGTVTNASGNPVAGAAITLQSLVGQRFSFTTATNATGQYKIDGVAIGAFTVSAISPIGETASAGGNIASDGSVVTLNLQLASSGIVGTVLSRDGVTPVGAGVTVTLRGGGLNTSAQTNTQGAFAFSVSTPSTYTLEASDSNGNRGQTSLVLTSIVPGSPKTVNVVFLGRGIVQGTVRDPAGKIQANLPVTLTSNSIFGGSANVTTDSLGKFRIENVFVGNFTVYSQDPVSKLAGIGVGSIAGDNVTVTADVTLAATGTVSGTVYKQDNTTPVANAKVDVVYSNGVTALTTTANNGAYSFSAVPLGDFTIVATNPEDGDKGQTVSRLTTLNEARNVNVRLIGQGTVRVSAVDADNQAVSGVAISLVSGSIFGGSQTAVTGTDGVAIFSKVFNGDVSVNGTKGSGITLMTGFAAGTLINSGTLQLSMTLSSKPVGGLAGVVTKGLNSDPQPGVQVRLQNLTNGGLILNTLTDANGKYQFDNLEVGPSYRITAYVNNRVRSRNDVTLTAGEITTANLVLLGVGSVNGLVTDAQNNPKAGIYVTLTNPDPVYGGSWQVTSQSDGKYNITDVPAGNFTIRALSSDNKLQAQDSGIVQFDGDVATVNLMLLDSSVSLPISLYDANATLFDMQGDGSIARGTNSVFRGNNSADVRGSRLEIIVNGVAVPFTNGDGTLGRLTQNGQLLEVDELNQASGLNVTRRVYVPKQGYFARMLEVLENRTTAPITVGLRVTSNFAPGVVGARIVDSSNNDAVLDVSNPANRDRWVIVDDDRDADPFESGGGTPSVAFVFDGEGAAEQASDAKTTAIGTVAKVSVEWTNITVQPGASVAYMHFTSQQLSRIPSRETAKRLSQLPPEALDGLTAAERASIRNFKVHADGVSTLQPLPAVEGSVITGTVFAGDGATTISAANVTYKSTSPYYGRTYRVNSDSNGKFTLKSQYFGTSSVVAIAQDSFNATAAHPQTKEITTPATGKFDAGQATVQQDLIFNGTGNLKGTVKRHNGTLVTSGTVSIPYSGPNFTGTSISTSIKSNGEYLFTGIAPRDYLATATQSHPQGTAITGTALGPVSVTPGNTSIEDITMEETGEITGIVRAANNDPVVNATVAIVDSNYSRYAQTDTGGIYRLTDVRTGPHSLRATGPTGLVATGSVSVSKDTQAVLNFGLSGTGTLNVQVNYQRGAAAINAQTRIINAQGYYEYKNTNAAGLATHTVASDIDIPIRASHPDNSSLTVQGTGRVTGDGGTSVVTLTLPGAGRVSGTVLRSDGATLASGVAMTLSRQDGTSFTRATTTNAAGSYQFVGVPLGIYTVSADDRVNLKYADGPANIDTDGSDVTVNLTLADNRVALPATLYDANNFKFDVQQNGSIGAGWRNSTSYRLFGSLGGSQLEVAGTTFTGDSSALLEAGRRQFAIRQATAISGLNITRKIFVPTGGYFARYLEILENPTAAAITVGVKVRSQYQNSSMNVVNTSSGDTAIQVIGVDQDKWVILDDSTDRDPFVYTSTPAIAQVLGAGSTLVTHDQWARTTTSGTRLEAGWSSITVPATGRVILMHFEVQQITRAGVKAAAERLSQLPPEAIQSLTSEEIAGIVNFNIPSDGISAVEPLPSLLGSVSGTVYEGDAKTVVPQTRIQVRSTHPLFGRTWLPYYYRYCEMPNGGISTLNATNNGVYSVTGRLLQDNNSIPIPVGSDVIVKATDYNCGYIYNSTGHPLTGVPSPEITSSFASNASSVVQDVVFPTGILTGTVVGPLDYGVSSGTLSTYVPTKGTVGVSIANGGNYVFPGLQPGTYALSVSVPHNQGTALTGIRPDALVTLGETTVTDVNITPTGSVNGAIITANGEPSVNSYTQLVGTTVSVTRTTYTDSLGRFNFSAVPVGTYTLTVTDARTNAKTQATVIVTQNQATTQNLVLIGTGSVALTVNFARGIPAAGTYVYLKADAVGTSFRNLGVLDAQGKFNVLVPVGNYTIRVTHSSDSNTYKELTGAISSNNEAQAATLTLPALASVNLTVLDQDAGNAPVSGAQISNIDSVYQSETNRGNTNGSGTILLSNLHEGNYTIFARYQGRLATLTGVIDAAVDGQTVVKTLYLSSQLDKLAIHSFVGEKHLYSVPVKANDLVSVSIAGAQIGTTPSAYLTRTVVYDGGNNLLADGYGYGSSNNYYQYNYTNNLKSILAPADGNLTFAVFPYYSNASYLGGYRLQVTVNGTAVDIQPYLDGGRLQGKVVRIDGTTPVSDQTVDILSKDFLGLHVRVLTDNLGNYVFDGVPVNNFTVSALDTQANLVLASSDGAIPSKGAVVQKDLRLAAKTTLQLKVNIGTGLSIPSQIYVSVTDLNGTRNVGPLTFTLGSSTSATFNTEVIGDAVVVRAQHPNDTGVTASVSVNGADGQVVPVTINLEATSVSGLVKYANGLPAPNVYVNSRRAGQNYDYSSTYTDGAGQYKFNSLPSGEEILIRAREPYSNVYSAGVSVTPQGAQTAAGDLQLVGIGSISGSVKHANGSPAANVNVRATYVYDDLTGATTTRNGYTNLSGAYTITGVPAGRLINLQANYRSFVTVTATASTTLASDGSSAQIDLVLPATGNTVVVRVQGTDDQPADSNCYYVDISAANGGYSAVYNQNCASVVFYGVPAGSITVNGYLNEQFAPVTAEVVDGQTTNVVIKVPVVKGVIRYSDGTAVANPGVSLTTTTSGRNLYAVNATADGVYRIYQVPVDTFTIVANDSASGLNTSSTGALTDALVPVTLNLTLPPAGTVSGVLRDKDDQPVADATVYLRSSGLAYDRQVVTDAQGQFTFKQVVLGRVLASALDPNGQNATSAVGDLVTSGQTLTLNLKFLADGSVSGVVKRSDGTAVANASVEVYSGSEGLAYSNIYYSTSTDSQGNYSINGVVQGIVTILATDPNDYYNIGLASNNVVSGASSSMDVVLGNAVRLSYGITDNATGLTNYIYGDGTFYTYGRDPLNNAISLRINGVTFREQPGATPLQSGQALGLGPVKLSGLDVTRRLYVPTLGGYLRVMDSLANNTASPITVSVNLSGEYYADYGEGYDPPILSIDPANNSGRYAMLTNPYPNDYYATHAAGFVFAGSGTVTKPSANFVNQQYAFSWGWNLTIQPGETVNLLNYAVIRVATDSAGAQTQLESLAGSTQIGMFDGLSAAEKSRVINFVVP